MIMGFNNNYNEQVGVCPCKDCRTRTITCHSICPSYQKWVRLQKIHSKQVKFMKKRAGYGVRWQDPYAR